MVQIILTVLAYTMAIILVTSIAISFIVAFKFISWFNWRACQHCHHTMEYRGLMIHNPEGEECYAFECPKCGAWEYIPKTKFFQETA